jgi:hypothetical protein
MPQQAAPETNIGERGKDSPGRGTAPIPKAVLVLLIVLTMGRAYTPPAEAHFGAPYPVLLEQEVGPYLASALADPDVGTGTFIVSLTLEEGSAVPAGTTLALWVRPEDGHVEEYGREAEREIRRGEERFIAEVPFDAEGPWQVRMEVAGPAGEGEVSFTVRVTPPGPGWLTTLACLTPFIGLGGLWVWSILRKERPDRPEAEVHP